MKRWNTVAIVGVGLIGGSIGLALRRRRLAREVVGIGRRASSLQKARRRGSVTTTTTQLSRGVAEADLVVVCTPVAAIVDQVLEVSEHCPPHAVLTDAGSTKERIVRQLDRRLSPRSPYVGSHPLAGGERAGPEHARDDLFRQRLVVVTPTAASQPAVVEAIRSFWSSLEANVALRSPAEHDRVLAATSHLPHLIAAALAAATSTEDLPFAAGGFGDTTRIAAGDPELWRQILGDNRRHVLKALNKFEKKLAAFRQALADDDAARLKRILEQGKTHRDAVGS